MADNEQRAHRAQDALEYYKRELLNESGRIDEDTLTDLLTDLRHLSARDRRDYDFEACVRMSETHYNAEDEPDDIEENLQDMLKQALKDCPKDITA